jgi:hypothetical protein
MTLNSVQILGYLVIDKAEPSELGVDLKGISRAKGPDNEVIQSLRDEDYPRDVDEHLHSGVGVGVGVHSALQTVRCGVDGTREL